MAEAGTIDCDILVAGAGIAGMTAAARAASLGLKTVLAGNSSGFYLVSGLFDLLGVYPLTPPVRLEDPLDGIGRLKKEINTHPYARINLQKILETFDFVKEFLNASGLEYVSQKNKNFQILTSVGTFKPSYLVPATMGKSAHVYGSQSRILLVDFKGFKGYSAVQIAKVLKKSGINAGIVTLSLPEVAGDFHPTRLAREFEKQEFLDFIAEKIRPHTRGIDLVGLPAVCGITGNRRIMASLEKMVGKGCFEIPGLPPSIPGLRLKNAFESGLRKSGVTLLSNGRIETAEFEKNHIEFGCISQNFTTKIKARCFVLATGRFSGGGLCADREIIRETLFGIPVSQPEKRKNWHDVNLFHQEGHKVNQAGLLTDNMFRPLDNRGKPVFKNLYAAGSILAGNDWTRLKSGAGVSCVSACCAVEHYFSQSGGGHV